MTQFDSPPALLTDIMTSHSKWHPNKTALIFQDQRVSWGEFNRRINKAANALIRLGIKKGDKVSVLMTNCVEMAVTLFGVFNCARVFLPEMIARGSGAIVNIASDAGRVGEAQWAVYSSAKGGVISFTRSLAKEVGKNGIRVNAVSPAMTMTEKIQAFVGDKLPKILKSYPMGRLAEPSEIAEAVVFLASERASYITGQTLSVNGGYSMVG